MTYKEKLKTISNAILTIEKKFGKFAVMRLGDKSANDDIPSFSSGSLTLDNALGIGGFPKGRLVEIYGPESSGKTTLTLHAVAQVQKQGGICAFIDAEHALDVSYAQRLGVNTDELLVSQPDHGEQALAIAQALLQTEVVDLIVIDSVAALVPKAELEGEIGDHHVGSQARMMSQAMRMLTGHASRYNATVIFINQIRHKIGVMFGNPETTTGGNALKFYASVRVDIRKTGVIKGKEKDEPIGARTRAKVIKNKMAPPFRVAEFDIIYGEGINTIGEIIDMAIEKEIISKSGAWLSFGETRLGNGKENATTFLKENSDLKNQISAAIKEKSKNDKTSLADSPKDSNAA
jgi:recombination protein RecA